MAKMVWDHLLLVGGEEFSKAGKAALEALALCLLSLQNLLKEEREQCPGTAAWTRGTFGDRLGSQHLTGQACP